MEHHQLLSQLFCSIDEKDARAFSQFLADDCSFSFGNLPPVSGKANIESFVSDFFDSIHALSHSLTESWSEADGIICHGSVSYTRHDRSVLTVPFCNIFKLKHDLIREYLIFADTSALYR